jgi:hypothetical protein
MEFYVFVMLCFVACYRVCFVAIKMLKLCCTVFFLIGIILAPPASLISIHEFSKKDEDVIKFFQHYGVFDEDRVCEKCGSEMRLMDR